MSTNGWQKTLPNDIIKDIEDNCEINPDAYVAGK